MNIGDWIIICGVALSQLLLIVLLWRVWKGFSALSKAFSQSAVPAVELRLRSLEALTMGHTTSIGRVVGTIGDLERRLADQLEALGLNQTKLLGHLIGTEKLVAEMLSQYRDGITRVDAVHSQVSSIGIRVGKLEGRG
jgi:hypothetical protein